MTYAEYMTAHALRMQHSGFDVEATIALFRRHGMSVEHLATMERRGNRYARGVPELPSAVTHPRNASACRVNSPAGDCSSGNWA